MKKNLSKLMLLALITNLFYFVMIPVPTYGQSNINRDIKQQLEPIEDIYSPGSKVDEKTFAKAIADVIRIILGFLGIIFLILILYAGFMWMTSAGNEEKISNAKKTMVAAVIGAAIVLAAYAITYFVISNLLIATGVAKSGLR
jgi:uncharacterized membrane protein